MRGMQVEGGVTPQSGLREDCTRSSSTGQPAAVLAVSGTQSALTSQEDRSHGSSGQAVTVTPRGTLGVTRFPSAPFHLAPPSYSLQLRNLYLI